MATKETEKTTASELADWAHREAVDRLNVDGWETAKPFDEIATELRRLEEENNNLWNATWLAKQCRKQQDRIAELEASTQ